VTLKNTTLPLPARRGEFSDIYRMSYNLYPIIGFALTGALSVVGSVLTGGLSEVGEVDPRLINPFMWKMLSKNSAK
jgi:hypothetical protein